MNSVNVIGNLTRDPECRKTSGGNTMAQFSIAVNVAKDKADFFDVVCWNNTADFCQNHAKKGKRVAVSGRLSQDRWEQDGKKRSKVRIIAENIDFMSSKFDDTDYDDVSENQSKNEETATAIDDSGNPPF